MILLKFFNDSARVRLLILLLYTLIQFLTIYNAIQENKISFKESEISLIII